jgi:hypothetical protein
MMAAGEHLWAEHVAFRAEDISVVKTKLAPKACAERKRLPRLTVFDTPSMPMAKYRGRSLAGLHGSFMP